MPDFDRDAIVWTEAEAEDRDALLLNLGRKVDSRRLAEVGDAAEETVHSAYLEILTREEGGVCERVSRISDDLGYDLRIRTTRGLLRVEVKAAAGTQLLRFFLTRNEAEVARRTDTWCIVICAHTQQQGMTIVGHLLLAQIEPYLPSDPILKGGSWEVCRIIIPAHQVIAGLPLPGYQE